MNPHPFSDVVLDGWTSRYCKSNSCNVLIHCLMRPISAPVASAPQSPVPNKACFGCGATFRQARLRGRSLVRLACGKTHVFCKQCILEYWRQPARKNIVDGKNVPSWAEGGEDSPWTCICPYRCGFQGYDERNRFVSNELSACWSGVKHWDMRYIDLPGKMGPEMQEYFQVPDDYLDRRKNTTYDFTEGKEESFKIVEISVITILCHATLPNILDTEMSLQEMPADNRFVRVLIPILYDLKGGGGSATIDDTVSQLVHSLVEVAKNNNMRITARDTPQKRRVQPWKFHSAQLIERLTQFCYVACHLGFLELAPDLSVALIAASRDLSFPSNSWSNWAGNGRSSDEGQSVGLRCSNWVPGRLDRCNCAESIYYGLGGVDVMGTATRRPR